MLSLIVARAHNGAIGKDNDIPWHLPEDLKFFQRETLGGAIIMGRNTWDSLPYKPLKSRLNIVVSRQADLAEHMASSVEDAIEKAYAHGYRRVYGIGGERLYAEMLPLAHRLLVTEVDLKIDAPDARFPEFDEADWHELGQSAVAGPGPTAVLRELIRR